MKQITASCQLISKHPFSPDVELNPVGLTELVLYSPLGDYELTLPFQHTAFDFGQEEDGRLLLHLRASDIDEESFLEENGYTLEQADLETFLHEDVSIVSYALSDMTFESGYSGSLSASDFVLSTLQLGCRIEWFKTVTIKSVA